jgi:hypothetical protein
MLNAGAAFRPRGGVEHPFDWDPYAQHAPGSPGRGNRRAPGTRPRGRGDDLGGQAVESHVSQAAPGVARRIARALADRRPQSGLNASSVPLRLRRGALDAREKVTTYA